jgi:hypothetical protein
MLTVMKATMLLQLPVRKNQLVIDWIVPKTLNEVIGFFSEKKIRL